MLPAVTSADTLEARQAAFEQMVRREAERLYRVALAIVDGPAEAEDTVQETMVTAWRRWSSVEAAINPTAWLTKVCVNHAIHQRRRSQRIMSLGRSPSAHPEVLGLYAQLLDLQRAYRTLSPRQRAIVTLHIEQGYGMRECAQMLGCRVGTAQGHLARARAKLRRELTTHA